MSVAEIAVTKFKGLNNRGDPTSLGWSWLVRADNVLCDDSGYLTVAPGSRQVVANGVSDAFAALDGRLFLLDSAGALTELTEDGARIPVVSGLVGGPFYWAEMGNALFAMSASHAWVVYSDRCVRWGEYCPEPDPYPEGFPIAAKRAYPPPFGGPICSRRTQMVVSVYEPDMDRSTLYYSRPGLPHEFYLDRDFTVIPGQVRLLASNAKGVVIGTDRAVYVDAVDAPMERAATFGVPAGGGAIYDTDQIYFWTHRGMCRAFPFEALTDGVYVPPVVSRAATGVLRWGGSRYAVTALSGAVERVSARVPFVPL